MTTEEGDIMLIDNAGAYAKCMSSQYNMRDPGVEIVLEKP
jgi:diaminopimelate decarboxylase/aspartate kinase